MPRVGPNYTLPEPPFVPQTPISSSAVNSDFSDIADALTASLARNGAGGMTAVLPLANTGFTYTTDPNTGMYRTAADEQAIKCGGIDVLEVTPTEVNVPVDFKINGVTAFPVATANIADNAVTFAKFQEVAASKLVGNPTGGATEVSEVGISGGLEFSGSTLHGFSVVPTIQRFTSGSGTYTTPAGVKWIRIRMVGGGGGGGGASNSANSTAGGNTTFSTLIAGGGGVASAITNGSAGGSASGGNIVNAPGGMGQASNGAANGCGGQGGASFFGGNGAGGVGNQAGGAGGTNTGGGGGGGGALGAVASGGGGGAGGYVEHIISGPAASYSYGVGAGGAGAAGTTGGAGGAGAAGLIIVEEHY